MAEPIDANRKLFRLFATGWVQVFLVAINTWQIAHEHYLGALFVGFGISLAWSFNVQRVAFGRWAERLFYAAGAAIGTVSGLWTMSVIY